uniref:C-type lectin domain-containing protein n=1 Tax=Oreochromis niloticus TaxID=8128 RepID=A0A669BYQ4_ORENI
MVSMFTMSPGRCYRLAAGSLALLAAVLLIVDLVTQSSTLADNKLTDSHLTLDDTERISKELVVLQDTYKTAVETMKDARKQLDSEMSRQTQTNWELEHQTKRSNDYKSQMEKITKEIETTRSRLSMISKLHCLLETGDGCKHCPAGWILMNSVCYYFPLKSNIMKTWKESRDFCQLQGGDLIIIDSQDEEVCCWTLLRQWWENGFWIGITDIETEDRWVWINNVTEVEYWMDGEPNNDGINGEDCGVAVASISNPWKTRFDGKCQLHNLHWICETPLTS